MFAAVLFDVDFTIARPGPELGPEGYRRLGERFGLSLDPSRYADARAKAVAAFKHWQTDSDLAGVRDPGAPGLAKLPEAEREVWGRLWAEVAELLKEGSRE